MKNYNSSILLSFFVAIALSLTTGCDKDPDNAVKLSETENPENTENYLQTILAKEQPIIQSFSVNASISNTITGEKGTKITIPHDAFVTSSGSPVSGNIDFELQEIFSAGDMIASGKMTSSGGKLLASGGEMFINATQGTSQLQLAPGKTLDFSVPTCNYESQMDLFVGNGQDGDNFDWVPATNSVVYQCQDSLNPCVTSYCFNLSDLFNWINCDYFYNDPRQQTEVEIQVPSGFDNTNTQVYAYIPSINSVTRTSYQNGSFWIKGGYKLPVGLAVTFVGLHYDGNDIYYSVQNANIVNNHIEILSFQIVTAAQLAQILASL